MIESIYTNDQAVAWSIMCSCKLRATRKQNSTSYWWSETVFVSLKIIIQRSFGANYNLYL